MSYRDVTRDRLVTTSLALLVSYLLGLSETSRERVEESVSDVAELVSNNRVVLQFTTPLREGPKSSLPFRSPA